MVDAMGKCPTPLSISAPEPVPAPVPLRTFDLLGREVSNMIPGHLYLLQYSDGSVRKIKKFKN
jgi:hypothetical protein